MLGFCLSDFIIHIIILLGVQQRTGGFANGAGRIWLDNVACNGRENRLVDCRANAFGVNNCNHNEDAGVRCPAERKPKVERPSHQNSNFIVWMVLISLCCCCCLCCCLCCCCCCCSCCCC